MEKLIAQLATIPEREAILEKVLNSVFNQFDEIHVQLNGFRSLPNYFMNYNGKVTWHFNSENNLADAEKFRGIENFKDCYFFTLDDDLIYPENYADNLVRAIEFYHRKNIVGLHGSVYSAKRPFTSYYYNRLETYRCLEDVDYNFQVDTLGTGCLAFHTSTIKLDFYKDFQYPFMADLLFSLAAKRQNIPLIVIKHKALIYLEAEKYGKTIWEHQNSNDELQTKILNEQWE